MYDEIDNVWWNYEIRWEALSIYQSTGLLNEFDTSLIQYIVCFFRISKEIDNIDHW